MFGDDSEEVTPVPIPNTEVKLFSADGSWGFPPVRVGRRQAKDERLAEMLVFFCSIRKSIKFWVYHSHCCLWCLAINTMKTNIRRQIFFDRHQRWETFKKQHGVKFALS